MNKRLIARILTIACIILAPLAGFAQLPTPTRGWNLGNTLEAIPTEGTWGPAATQNLINSVAAAGFNTVRIPCAWGTHSDQSTLQIDPTYMARVKQVVDWCYAKNLYVIVNCHWDKGWLDYNIDPTLAPPDVVVDSDSRVTQKMNSYWTQIANTFKGYDNKLLFAGANEPPVKTSTQMSKLLSYYQTFVNAVRATGGNNSSRWLVVQGPSTDIDLTDQLMNTLPNDWVAGRLAVEIHYYAPFQFCLMGTDASWGSMAYFWGQGYHSSTLTNRNSTWGEEAFLDAEFQKMQTKFVSRGVPVIVGEFAAMKRSTTDFPDLSGTELLRHYASHTYFHKYLLDSANSKGLKPIYWDTPSSGDFDWTTGAIQDRDNIRALTGGAALPPPGGGGIVTNGIYKVIARHSGKALEVSGQGTTDQSNVQQWSYWGGDNQKWTLMHLGNNQYKIIGLQSGKALDVSGGQTGNGTNVQIWTYLGGPNQIWTISATSGGYFRLTPTHAPSMCLDVNGSQWANDGANVQIWQYLVGTNQQWIFQAP
jgi:aryl-phospho-beta-D-glucosidase BglC (GH1 family)